MATSLLGACGSSSMSGTNLVEQNSEIDSEIAPYVARFEAFYGSSVDEVSIIFGETLKESLPANTIGYCSIGRNDERVITLSEYFWNEELAKVDATTRDLWREVLVFHELGHCELLRPHRVAQFSYEMENGDFVPVPTSVMYPFIPFPSYASERQYYIAELFGRSASPPGTPLEFRDGNPQDLRLVEGVGWYTVLAEEFAQ